MIIYRFVPRSLSKSPWKCERMEGREGRVRLNRAREGGNGNTHINPLLSEPQVGCCVRGTSHQVLTSGQRCCGFRRLNPHPATQRRSCCSYSWPITMCLPARIEPWGRCDGRGLRESKLWLTVYIQMEVTVMLISLGDKCFFKMAHMW